MVKSRFSYLKLTAVVAVLAIALLGLNGRLSRTTVAREKGTTTRREIAPTPAQKFSERTATVLAAERDVTTPTLPTTDGCNLSGAVKITALELTKSLAENKIEVGWNFTMPQQLAALGICAKVDHFKVSVIVHYESGAVDIKVKDASALARNEVIKFTDIVRKVKDIQANVTAEYKIEATSDDILIKGF